MRDYSLVDNIRNFIAIVKAYFVHRENFNVLSRDRSQSSVITTHVTHGQCK